MEKNRFYIFLICNLNKGEGRRRMKMYIKHAFAFSKGEEKKTLLLGLTTEEDIIIKDDVIFKGKYEGKIN